MKFWKIFFTALLRARILVIPACCIICLPLIAVSLFSTPAMAADHCEPLKVSGFVVESRPRYFMVSGVLRLNSAGMEIKLAHSREQANSSDEALGSFTRKALQTYPGYTIATTLVSEIAGEQPQCAGRPNERNGIPEKREVSI